MDLKIKLLTLTAKLPTYAYVGDAGMDVYSDEDLIIKPDETKAVKTGIASEFDKDYVALVWDKSGMGAKGIHRFSGVIDASYRGEWLIVLHNSSDKNYNIEKGDKIAQVLIQKVERAEIVEVDDLTKTQRGSGKFGSTGKK